MHLFSMSGPLAEDSVALAAPAARAAEAEAGLPPSGNTGESFHLKGRRTLTLTRRSLTT